MFSLGTLNFAYMDFQINHRALTDNHAFNTKDFWGRDYILKLNSSSIRSWMMKSLTFTGNIVKKLNPQPSGILPQYVAIETLDYFKAPPSLEWVLKNKPYLIWWTTEQSGAPGELPSLNGQRRWTVARFPQLKQVCKANGLEEVGTPYLAIGKGGYNLIKKTDLLKIENGEKYSPYVPEK
jgi:hypothetical protein